MTYELIVRNGTVIDGKGGPRFKADIAVNGGQIVAIGEIDEAANGTIRSIDAAGK